MPFQIDPGFDPGTILSRQRLPEDPNVLAANALKLKAAQQDQELFPLRKQATELELKSQQIIQQEHELGLQEAKTIQQTQAQIGFDPKKLIPALTGKVRGSTLNALITFNDTHETKRAEAEKLFQDADKLKREGEKQEGQVYSDMAADVLDNYTPQHVQFALALLPERYQKQAAAMRQLYESDPEKFKEVLGSMVLPETKKARQALAASKAEQAKTEADTKLTDAKVPGEKAKSDIEVAEAASLKAMTPQDFLGLLDSTVTDKNSPRYKRTRAAVDFYLNKEGGPTPADRKAIMNLIQKAGDQLGQTETAVATAKATAPIKLDLFNTENAARMAAPEIKPGSAEYRVAQDLGYGKLRFNQFISLYPRMAGGGMKQAIYQLAGQLNPNFNPSAFEMGYALAANPKAQQQLAALDNVMQAVPDLLKLSDEAKRTGVTAMNGLVRKGGFALGGKTYSNFNTAITAFADELSGALGFGSATDMSREMGLKMTDGNLSPDNFRSSIQDVVAPFIGRKRDTMLKQMGVYGQPGMNPAAGGGQAGGQPGGGGNSGGGRKPLSEIFK